MSKITKIQLPLGKLTGDTFSVNITIPNQTDFAGRRDVINSDFVSKEVSNAINGIEDYELRRFLPINEINNTNLDTITYSLYDENGNTLKYVDLGFNENDIKFNRNKFSKTFLQLDFFDGTGATNNIKVFTITLFPSVTETDLLDIPNIPVKFTATSPFGNQTGESEGYYLYYFRSLFNNPGDSLNLYMEASLKNAKTGSSTNLMKVPSVSNVNALLQELYTEFFFERTTNRYHYYVTSTNKTFTSGQSVEIKLYPRLII